MALWVKKTCFIWLLGLILVPQVQSGPAECQGLLKRYLRLNPPGSWDYDWTTAIFLYGALKYAQEPERSQIITGLKALAQHPPEITMPDLAAMSLPATLLQGAEAERIKNLTRGFFKTEPLNTIGAINHVGERHKFYWFLPHTSFFVPASVWADSMIMYVLNGYLLGDDPEFFLKQARILDEKLLVPTAGLYKHAYYVETGERYPAEKFWARGNLWMSLGMVEILAKLAPTSPHYAFLRGRLNSHLKAVGSHLSTRGLRTLLDDPTSYPESSATALYAYVLVRGRRLGILDFDVLKFESTAVSAARSFLQEMKNGEVSLTSVSGPTTAFKYPWYYTLLVGRKEDLSYGVGAMLLLCSTDSAVRS